jgi:hypothetical protein
MLFRRVVGVLRPVDGGEHVPGVGMTFAMLVATRTLGTSPEGAPRESRKAQPSCWLNVSGISRLLAVTTCTLRPMDGHLG